MSYIVGIDTGKRACGVSIWENGYLLTAGYVHRPFATHASLTEVVSKTVSLVEYYVFNLAPKKECDVFIEIPRTYGGRAGRGDANDLIAEALVAGALSQTFPKSTLLLPQAWKGSTPKDVTVTQLRQSLSAEELSRINLPGQDKRKNSNVWDAVGIGLYVCWRFGCRPR